VCRGQEFARALSLSLSRSLSLSLSLSLALFLSQTDAMCFLVSRWAHTIPIADMGAYQKEWLGSVINIY